MTDTDGKGAWPYHDTSAHHTARGFRTPGAPDLPGFGALLRWRWQRWRTGIRERGEPAPATPLRAGDLEQPLPPGVAARAVWFGHTSFWIETAGQRFLIDPVFGERASPFRNAGPRRRVSPPLALDAVPRLDAVLLTHDHYDHLDARAVHHLAHRPGPGPAFVAPLGVDDWLRRRGVPDVRGLDWYQSIMVGIVRVTLLPAQHWSSRTPFDRQRRLWGGWLLEADGFAFVHLGDTGYGPVLADVGAFLRHRVPQGIDLAAVPVGAYEPRWFMAGQHLDPGEAVRLHLELGFRRSIPVHWGTFWLTDEPLDEPPRRLRRELETHGVPVNEFGPVAVGEVVHACTGKASR